MTISQSFRQVGCCFTVLLSISICPVPYVPGVRILLRLGSIYVTFSILIRFLLHFQYAMTI